MIRVATRNDFAALRMIEEACWPPEMRGGDMTGLHAVVAERAGHVVAAAYGREPRAVDQSHGGEWVLYSLETLPAYRGLGLAHACARRLLEGRCNVVAYAVSDGGRAVCHKLGFEPTGARREMIPGVIGEVMIGRGPWWPTPRESDARRDG